MKKMICLLVLGMLVSATAFASEEAPFVFPDGSVYQEKQGDVRCTGTTRYERPEWQRVLSFGLANPVVVKKEDGVLRGASWIVAEMRPLSERNPDLLNVLGPLIGKLFAQQVPNAISTDIKCGDGENSFAFTFSRVGGSKIELL